MSAAGSPYITFSPFPRSNDLPFFADQFRPAAASGYALVGLILVPIFYRSNCEEDPRTEAAAVESIVADLLYSLPSRECPPALQVARPCGMPWST